MSICCKRGFLRLACTGQDGLSSSGCLHTGKAESPERLSLCIWSPLQSQADLETWKISREPWPSIHIARIKKWNLMSDCQRIMAAAAIVVDALTSKKPRQTGIHCFLTSEVLSPAHQLGGASYSEGRRICMPHQQQILSGSSLTDIQRYILADPTFQQVVNQVQL